MKYSVDFRDRPCSKECFLLVVNCRDGIESQAPINTLPQIICIPEAQSVPVSRDGTEEAPSI
jgi:hypothetical protein